MTFTRTGTVIALDQGNAGTTITVRFEIVNPDRRSDHQRLVSDIEIRSDDATAAAYRPDLPVILSDVKPPAGVHFWTLVVRSKRAAVRGWSVTVGRDRHMSMPFRIELEREDFDALDIETVLYLSRRFSISEFVARLMERAKEYGRAREQGSAFPSIPAAFGAGAAGIGAGIVSSWMYGSLIKLEEVRQLDAIRKAAAEGTIVQNPVTVSFSVDTSGFDFGFDVAKPEWGIVARRAVATMTSHTTKRWKLELPSDRTGSLDPPARVSMQTIVDQAGGRHVGVRKDGTSVYEGNGELPDTLRAWCCLHDVEIMKPFIEQAKELVGAGA